MRALGLVVWSMGRYECDDALATAAVRFRDRVDQVRILSPDKDLAQCIVGDRVVLVDRIRKTVLDEAGLRARRGIAPGEPARLPGARRRRGRRFSGAPRFRREDRVASPRAIHASRRSRRTRRSGRCRSAEPTSSPTRFACIGTRRFFTESSPRSPSTFHLTRRSTTSPGRGCRARDSARGAREPGSSRSSLEPYNRSRSASTGAARRSRRSA